MSILSLNTSPSYNKYLRAKKIPWRDLWCNCRQAGKQGEHMPAPPAAGCSRSWFDLQPGCSAGQLPVLWPLCEGLSLLQEPGDCSCLILPGQERQTQADNGISADRRMPGAPHWQ